MVKPYYKLEEIKTDVKYQPLLEVLIEDIERNEEQSIHDDAAFEYFSEKAGVPMAKYMMGTQMALNQRILHSLRVAFWYYTGVSPSKLLEKQHRPVDIFDPLKEP